MDIRVATYNFYARPRKMFWDNQVDRARKLAKQIQILENKDGKKIDVLCLQEIVDNKVHEILKKELKKIGFLFKSKRLDINWRINGGVVTYSRFPIVEQTSKVFKIKNSSIIFAPVTRGAVHVKVMKNARYYNIINTHLDAYNREYRKQQMIVLNDWINEQYFPEDQPIIIGGDFNIDYHKEEINNVDEVFEYDFALLDTTKSISDYTIDSSINEWVKRRTKQRMFRPSEGESMLIDFFIYDSDDITDAKMKIVDLESDQKIKKIFARLPFNINIYTPFTKSIKDLSDHFMVICDFN